jgi:hypothetical protein
LNSSGWFGLFNYCMCKLIFKSREEYELTSLRSPRVDN